MDLNSLRTKLHTLWIRKTYPFVHFGEQSSVDASCQIGRENARRIYIGNDVYVAPDVWLNVEPNGDGQKPAIYLGNGSKIGRRSVISAKNRITLEADVLLAPGVLIMDHNHEYTDPDTPIYAQGTTKGGEIFIGRNCWLGYGAVICSGDRQLEIGANSVVGANAVVTKSFPPGSVIAGNPGVLIRRYEPASNDWVAVGRDVRVTMR